MSTYTESHPAGYSALTGVADAVATMAERLHGIDTGEVWGKFTCSEVESIADVLEAFGHADAAAFIIAEHAEGDEFGDDHWIDPDAVACAECGETIDADDMHASDTMCGSCEHNARRSQ